MQRSGETAPALWRTSIDGIPIADVSKHFEGAKADVFVVSFFSMGHWTKIGSTNPLERASMVVGKVTE